MLQINYSELARQYGIKQDATKLGSMVVKEFLESEGVDLSKFGTYHKQTRSARRRLSRMTGGEVPIPVPRTNSQIMETVKVSLNMAHAICHQM